MRPMVHLHAHTYYSDGILSPKELSDGCDVVAITDHGTLAAHWFSSDACKVLRGIELYVDLPLELTGEKRRGRGTCHLTVLADGEQGWREIVELNRLAWQNHYYVPRLPLDAVCGEHIIVLSGCPASPVAKLYFAGKLDESERVYRELAERFKGRFYAEVQAGTEIQDAYSKWIIELATRYGHTVVYTRDVHYNDRFYRAWRASRHGFDCPSLSSDSDVPEPMIGYYHNAIALANSLSPYSITGSFVPPQTDDSIKYIIERCKQSPYQLSDDDKARLDYEIRVMIECGIMGYMELADRVFGVAKRVAGKAVVRGSVASSLVAFCLGWSEFHPDRYGLIFERFVSPKRRELPDVDIDIPSSKRADVIAELGKLYPLTYIATELTYGEKAARNQVQRYLKDSKGEGNIDDGVVVDLVNRVFGIGVHASGLAIIPDSLNGLLPIRVVDDKPVCEFPMDKLMTVKIDILGQKTLDVLLHCNVPSCASVPDTDMIDSAKRNTIGLFQLEGAMRDYARWCLRRGYSVPFIISMYRPAVIDSGILYQASTGQLEGLPDDVRSLCHHGFPVYQEDLLRVLSKYIPIEHAYTVMKITAKKDRAYLRQYLSDNQLAIPDDIVELCEHYSGYGFNMAHAAAYAQRAWQTAWARLYRPHLFWPKMIDSESDDVMRAAYVMAAARQFKVEPPDGTSWDSRVVGNTLILGMVNVVGFSKTGSLLNGSGKDAVEAMLKANNKKNRDILSASQLVNLWTGGVVDINAMRRHLRVPCRLDLRSVSRLNSMAELLDAAYDGVFGLKPKDVSGDVLAFGDGERATDGTAIVYAKTPPYQLVRCRMTVVPSKKQGKVWSRLVVVG